MLAMVALGFGEIAGAILMGRIVDKLGSKKTSLVNVVLVLIATIFVLNFLYLNRYSVFAFFMTFFWGF
jgi:predicted MFS family arabinose efflux permease